MPTFTEEMEAGAPRHAGVITVKTGVKLDGTITAREVRTLFDGGAYAAHRAAPGVGLPSVVRACGPYRIPHARVESSWAYTNSMPGGIMRGPGQPQLLFASESQIDMIAHALGLDPLEMRLRNVVQEGDLWPTGDRFEGVNARQTLEAARDASEWGQPLGPNRGRGIAISDRPIGTALSGLTLRLDTSGGITAISGIPDIGTGAFTILRAVLAEQLQVPLEAIEIVAGDTNTALFDAGMGGSKTTFSSNFSANETTTALIERLSVAAAERLECSTEDVELAGGIFQVRGAPGGGIPLLSLGAELAAANGGALEFSSAGTRERPKQPCFVVYVVEVEVDPETGQITVVQVTSAP